MKMQNIISCIIRYFINSCGISTIFMVYSNRMLSIEEIKILICSIFTLQCFFGLVVVAGKYVINEDKLCFCHEEEFSIPIKKKAGKSTRKNESVLSEQEEELLDIICIHEAGHVIAAWANNMEIIEVRSSLKSGYTKLKEKLVISMDGEYFEKMAAINYAGAVAEEIFTGEIHAGCIGTEMADFEMAEKNIRNSMLLSNDCGWKVGVGIEFDAELQKRSKELYRKAYQIIIDNKENVKIIAENLKLKEQMTGKEIKNIIEIREI